MINESCRKTYSRYSTHPPEWASTISSWRRTNKSKSPSESDSSSICRSINSQTKTLRRRKFRASATFVWTISLSVSFHFLVVLWWVSEWINEFFRRQHPVSSVHAPISLAVRRQLADAVADVSFVLWTRRCWPVDVLRDHLILQ